jgi:hypothetical protein
MLKKGGFYMRGTVVIARAFGGEALVRRVWEAANGLVYLCSDAEFEKLQKGSDALPPIGFPASDVFVYEADALKQQGIVKWADLKQWKPYKVVATGE